MFYSNSDNNLFLGRLSFCWSWDSDYWSHGLLWCCCLAIGIISYIIFYIPAVFQPFPFMIVFYLEWDNRSTLTQESLKFISNVFGKLLPSFMLLLTKQGTSKSLWIMGLKDDFLLVQKLKFMNIKGLEKVLKKHVFWIKYAWI